MRIGINGFGRMGRLALRIGWEHPELEFVAVNEPHGDTETLALLTEFDSSHGRFGHACSAVGAGELQVGGRRVVRGDHSEPAAIPWADWGVDVVLESSGKFRQTHLLQPHFDNGATKVLVSAPVKDGPPNLVVGVNDADVDVAAEPILTAASCTTNCVAPIIRVLHDAIGIDRGLFTTIHQTTNTQAVLDRPHKDPRRARAVQPNLIPTSTNSATAVALIIPELEGRLDSMAVRVPSTNASMTDTVLAVRRPTDVEEVNAALEQAAKSAPLEGILGFETRPLVSSDFVSDPRSSVVDAQCTRVTDETLVKVMAWYDSEYGYANRLVDLLLRIAATMRS